MASLAITNYIMFVLIFYYRKNGLDFNKNLIITLERS